MSMLRVASALLAVLLHVVCAAEVKEREILDRKLVDFAGQGTLNNYFSGKTIGSNPGPCPFEKDCEGDIQNAPDYIKAIRINNWPRNIFGGTTSKRIDEIITRGIFNVWDLSCDSLTLNTVDFIDQGYKNSKQEYQTKIDISNLNLGCTGTVSGDNVRISSIPLIGSISLCRFQSGLIISETADITAQFNVRWYTNTAKNDNFDNSIPHRIDFISDSNSREVLDRSGNGACNILIPDSNGLDLPGLDLDFSCGGGLLNSLISLIAGLLIGLIIDLFKALIEGIICEIIVQLSYIDINGNRDTLGGINLALEDVYAQVKEWQENAFRDRADIQATEDFLLATRTDINAAEAINFKENDAFETLSFSINELLGTPNSNTDPKYQNTLVINEVVDLLLNQTDELPGGIWDVPSVTDYFQMSESTFTSEVAFDLSGVRLILESFRIEGLNQFTNFRVLDMGFALNIANPDYVDPQDRYTYTLDNQIAISQLNISIGFSLQFFPGPWITAPVPAPDSDKEQITVDITLNDLDFKAAIFTLFNPELLRNVQVGSVLADTATQTSITNCLGKVLDHLNLTNASLSFSSIETPEIGGTAGTFGELIEEVSEIVLDLINGGLEYQLPGIVQGGLREFVNGDFLEDQFVDPSATCPAYVSQGYIGAFSIADSIGFGFGKNVLDNVIGGNPISDNDADINSLIDLLIQYYAIDNEDLDVGALERVGRGDYKYEDNINFRVEIEDTAGPTFNQNDFLEANIGGPRLFNVDSISALEVETVFISPGVVDPYVADVTAQWGYYNGPGTYDVEPIQLSIPIKLDSIINDELKAAEDFDFQLNLSIGVDFIARAEINKDNTYLSEFGDLLHVPCVLALLDTKSLTDFAITLEDFQFDFDGVISDGPSGTPLGRNITLLKSEIENGNLLEYFLNYLFGRFTNETMAFANQDFVPPYEIIACRDDPSPLGNVSLGQGFPLPNFEAINREINKAVEPQPNPRDPAVNPSIFDLEREGVDIANPEDVFNITDEANGFLELVAGAFTPGNIRDFMVLLGNTTVDPAVPSLFDPLIEILRYEEDDSVSLVIDIGNLFELNFEPDVDSLIEGLNLRFYPVVVRNIDKLDTVEVLQPFRDGTFTTISDFGYNPSNPSDYLSIELGLEFEVAGVVLDSPNPTEYQSINTSITLENLGIALMTSGAVKTSEIKKLRVGDLAVFDLVDEILSGPTTEAVECLLPQLFFNNGVKFQQLQFNVSGDKVQPAQTVVEGTAFSTALVGIIDSLIEILLATFTKQIPNISQGVLRSYVNDFINEQILAANDDVCDRYDNADDAQLRLDLSSKPTGEIFNFATSIFSDELEAFIDGDVLQPGRPFYINNIIRQISDVVGAKTTIVENQEIVYNKQSLGTASAAIGEVTLPTLGRTPIGDQGARVVDLQLLKNAEYGTAFPKRTKSFIKFEGNARTEFRLAYAFDGLFEDKTGGKRPQDTTPDNFIPHLSTTALYNDITFGIDVVDLYVELEIDIGLDIPQLMNQSFGDLLGLYEKPSNVSCLLALFEEDRGLAPVSFTFNFSSIGFDLTCASDCTTSSLVTGTTSSGSEVNEALTSGFQAAFTLVKTLLEEANAQTYIDIAIQTAREECIALDVALPNPFGEIVLTPAGYYLFISGFSCLAVALVYFTTLVPVHAKRKRRTIKMALAKGAQGQKEYIERRLSPLIYHRVIPKYMKILIPSVIGIGVCLFVAANFFTSGVTILLKLTLFGDVTKPVSLIDFTLEKSLDDAWNSGAYPLCVVLYIASGFWPYTKLILLWFCVLAPVTILKTKTRGKLAETLDSLGKWSLIDAYVLILLQVAFRIYITTNSFSLLESFGSDILVVDVLVKPGFGIYGFLLGTISSLLINHLIIWYHRKAEDADEEEENQLKNYASTEQLVTTKKRLCKYMFFIDDEKYAYGYGRGIQVVCIFLLGMAFLLMFGGLWLPLLTFQFSGIAGILLGFIDPNALTSTNSALSVIGGISDGADQDFESQAGIIFLQFVYIMFVIITPLILISLFMVMFFAKLTLKEQKTLLFMAEITAAWEALFILSVSCIAAVFQIGFLADFIAKAATGNLCKFIEDTLIGFGVEEDDAKCLDVEAVIEPPGYVLIIGSVLIVIATIVMIRLLSTAIHDRELLAKYRRAKKAGNKEQMNALRARAKHPMKYKGCIIGPLMRATCVKYPNRRARNQGAGSFSKGGSFSSMQSGMTSFASPSQQKFAQQRQVSNPNPLFGTATVDDVEV